MSLLRTVFYYNEDSGKTGVRPDMLFFVFYLMYLILSLGVNLFLIEYVQISYKAILLYLSHVIFISLGCSIASRSQIVYKVKRFSLDVKYIISGGIVLSILTAAFSWYSMIRYYGSLHEIFSHAYFIREANIGGDADYIPAWVNYLYCFVFVTWIFTLIKFFEKISFLRGIVLLVVFILILAFDLRVFGRIGMLFAIFSALAAIIIYRIKVFRLRYFFTGIASYFLFMLPRMFRGGFLNFTATFSKYNSVLKINIHPIFFGIITIVVYYFSSLFAFSEIINFGVEFEYGERMFAPVINLIRRVLPFLEIKRVNLIDPVAHIPFEHNIYSIVGDLFSDFGYFGVTVVSFIMGLFFGSFFGKNDFISKSFQIFFIAWLFYSPVYNIFNFGTFFLPFMYMIIIGVVFKLKI